MTDFMTALRVIFVQPTCPGEQRAEGVLFQSTCSLCRESHRTRLWLRFLVLSVLSAYTCAVCATSTADVMICLKMLKNAIEKSDAMLYAPSANDVEEKCKNMSLRCYMLELMMVIEEEHIWDNNAECISDFNDALSTVNSDGCAPCEAYSLKNITIFLERLTNLLEEMNVRWNVT